ncbi:putative proline rich protein [Mycobacterium bohemicum DSM 44277]|uniref:Putative proline rich protein n=1 Tax=Mycobacterium bohemicum DSM 44277 TaxID=1236609 RepID=A0A0U0WF93_MYCBE|nr:putative proline rich protein [Mycobacterium bohemicum DSM 44277]
MKFTVSVLEKRSQSRQRPWSHLFGGRVRTSTVVLIIAFCAVWWLYDTYRPEPAPKPPANQVVPPGFVPDPNYTWVPRSRVQQPPPTVTVTPIPTTTTPTPTPTSTVPPPTTTTPPPFAPVVAAAGRAPDAGFGAAGQLTSLASEGRGYTGVP